MQSLGVAIKRGTESRGSEKKPTRGREDPKEVRVSSESKESAKCLS